MDNIIKRVELSENVHFSNINDFKFKFNRISINFAVPLSDKTAAKNSLLALLMKKSCKKYPSFLLLNKKLSELYGASISTNISKVGCCQLLSFQITSLDNKFSLNNENILKESCELLINLILEPLFINKEFNKNDFENEKQFLIDTIESEINNKRSYAIKSTLKLMLKGSKSIISKYGEIEDVKLIKNSDLYETYKNLINKSKIEIIFIGPGNKDIPLSIFKDKFTSRKININEFIDKEYSFKDEINNYTEKLDVIQSKMVLGYSTGKKLNIYESIPMLLAINILGGTPSSKLFLNVREKMSLCYYCTASFYRLNSLMLIDAGIEKDKYDKAYTEILNQVNDLILGDFNDETLEAIKLQLINNLISINDSLGTLEDYYLTHLIFDEIVSIDEIINIIKKTNKSEIVKFAQNLKLRQTYLLTSKESV